MTPEQFDRWHDFATRMARACYGKRRRGKRVEGRYVSCATPSWIAETVALILNDLRSDAAKIGDWDGYGPNHEEMLCVGDAVNELIYHGDALRAEPDQYYDDDTGPTDAWTAWDEQWISPVRCCLRSGLDVASEPARYGVVGFTIGDIRKMYPDGVPSWITERFVDRDGKPLDLSTQPDAESITL